MNSLNKYFSIKRDSRNIDIMDHNDIQQGVKYRRKGSHSNASGHAQADLIVQGLLKWTSKWTIYIQPAEEEGKDTTHENMLN